MEITQKLLSLGKQARPGIKFIKPLEKIIIHWIGPFPNQIVSIPRNWWENGSDGKGIQASAHFIIKDADIIQCVPLNEVAWHSGDSRNYSSIGVEIIPMNINGEFSKMSIDTLYSLVNYIREKTGIYLQLERHYDGTQKKDCPLFYTPFSKIINKNADGCDLDGQQRWKELKCFLNEEKENTL
jgi:N-acetylmuramoyl-L-alanine amidase